MTSGFFSSAIGTERKARFRPSAWLSYRRTTPSAPPTATVAPSGLNAVAYSAVSSESLAKRLTPLVWYSAESFFDLPSSGRSNAFFNSSLTALS